MTKDISEIKEDLKSEILQHKVNYYNVVFNFCIKNPVIYDKSKAFWIWDNKECVWGYVDECDLLNQIDKMLESMGYGVNTVKSQAKNEMIESFKRIGRRKFYDIKEIKELHIQFNKEIYYLETKEKQLSTPEFFVTNNIKYNVSKNSDTPIMDKLFKEWVGEEYVQTLYEIIAYSCIPSYPIHRIFCFTGSGRNGKSQYLKLLTKFIGVDNSCSTEIDTLLDNRFETAKLHRKLLCQMGETNYSAFNKTALLKKLSGGDLIGFERKGKDPFDDYNYAKIILATNGIPISHDKSEGWFRRWFIIDFPNKFPEGKDIIETIPKAEYNNLARKCLELLPNLLDNGKFYNEPSIEEKKIIYEQKSNPLGLFLKENTEEDICAFIFKWDFYQRFNVWLNNNGYRNYTEKIINSIMKDKFEDGRKRKEDGTQNWAFLGLKWKDLKKQIEVCDKCDNNDTKSHSEKYIYKNKSENASFLSLVSQEKTNNVYSDTKNNILAVVDYVGYIDFVNAIKYPNGKEVILKLKKAGVLIEREPNKFSRFN